MIQPSEQQHHSIWTPELVELELPLAGLGRRFLGMLVDQLVIGVIITGMWTLYVILVSTLGVGAALSKHSDSWAAFGFLGITILISVATLLLAFGYFWGFHTFNNGRSLGKMVVGVRLVTDRGGWANGWTCFIRSLFDLADWLAMWGAVSAIMILMTDKEKRIADYAAGTLVILDR